jgi:hypothetical protein
VFTKSTLARSKLLMRLEICGLWTSVGNFLEALQCSRVPMYLTCAGGLS